MVTNGIHPFNLMISKVLTNRLARYERVIVPDR
jgi:hypothetical protein